MTLPIWVTDAVNALPKVSTTSVLGTAKIIVGGLAMISGVVYVVVTKDVATGLGIIGAGGTLAGMGSGVGLIKAADAKTPKQ